ncbi:MAG: hypothetical protein J6N78_02060 [Clostridia bacterium]|nr:hypothetical protein [Clostridia bacterium]
MAFVVKKAKGNNLVADRRQWIGIAAFKVRGVNLTKQGILAVNKQYKAKFPVPSEEPVYITTSDEGMQQLRFSFFCETRVTDEKGNPTTLYKVISFTVRNGKRIGRESGKIQIIDAYGQDAWGLPEEVEAGKIPMYTSGPANIDKNYKPALQGEVELVKFIRALKQIPSVQVWDNDNQKFSYLPENRRDECQWAFNEGELEEMFKLGNVTRDFQADIMTAKENEVWLPMTIQFRTKDDGTIQEYNTVNTRVVESSAATRSDGSMYNRSTNSIINSIARQMEANRNENTTELFEACLLKEYKKLPTDETMLDSDTESSIEETNEGSDLPF